MSRQPEFAAADIDTTFSTLSSATHWCPQIRVPCPAPQFAQILQLLHTHAPHRTPEIACADLHTAEQLPLNHAQDCRLLLCCTRHTFYILKFMMCIIVNQFAFKEYNT